MTCPICGKPTEAKSRPFCSKRCTDVDLARWFNGAYSVPSQDPDDHEELEQALEEAQKPDDRSKPH